MAERILVVDDEKEITDLVALYLGNEGYEVDKCYCGEDALALIRDENREYDLAILDLMLPDIDGFQICMKIRENFTYPIIMLTAKSQEMDKVRGLMTGADDYITKPFLPLEMVARVKAQIRRYKRYDANRDEIEVKGLSINRKTHACYLNGNEIELTNAEYMILEQLMLHMGKTVSAEELFRAVTGSDYFTRNNNTVSVHIRHLREKIGDSYENPRYIKTVWGTGYKIEKETV